MSHWLARFRDSLDQSFALIFDHRAVALGTVLLLALGIWWIIRRYRRKDAPGSDILADRAQELARESARLVATALEERDQQPMQAYFHAVQAVVMARTAQELESGPRLSASLGIDFSEYIHYTSKVLGDIQTRLLSPRPGKRM